MTRIVTKKYTSKHFNIPFYEKQGEAYKLKIKVNRIDSNNDLDNHEAEILQAGCDEFITSFLPEFYSYLYDEQYFEENCRPDNDCTVDIVSIAADLKNSIIEKTSVEYWYQTSPVSNKTIAILKCYFDFDGEREKLESNNKMPLYQPNLDFFNQQQNITGPDGETTLVVGTIGTENKLLNNGLRTFDTQYKGFEGQLKINADFNVLQSSATKILNIIVTELAKQTRIQTPSYNFSEADTITLKFGKKGNRLALHSLDYLIVEESISSQPLKIGYFSIAKYNEILNDPLLIAVLKNYDNIITSVQDTLDTQSPYSFYDFMSASSEQGAFGDPIQGGLFDNFNPQPKKEFENELLKAASEFNLIDVKNVESLEEGFTTSLTTEQVEELKTKIVENPDVYKRVFAERKAKALNTGVAITKVVGNVLEQGPMGFIESANPQVAYIFRQFGLDELAKEAMLCLTFGLNFEIGRINQAVQNSLLGSSSSIYYPPDVPKAASISKPSFDLEAFKPFTVDGEIWKEILKTIVDSLQQSVLEIIQKLADLLRESCDLNTPAASDYGANDITDFIQNDQNPENALLPTVGAGSQLDQISSKNGMTNEQILTYLSSLSQILSSIEICMLFVNRADVSAALLDKIIDFNSAYDLDIVRNQLDTASSILGFFADLSATVDVTNLCNQIANQVYQLNTDNVCLLTGDDEENIQDLIDLIEDGLQLNLPDINLDCPDSKFATPLITKSIPETFNTLAETVQIQFIASADSTKEILLEPVVSNRSTGVLQSLRDANVSGSRDTGQLNLGFLEPIIGVFDTLSDTFSQEGLANCPVSIEELLGFDGAMAAGDIQTALETLSNVMSSGEFKGAIDGIADKMRQTTDSLDSELENPIYTTYRFNSGFFNAFKDYIDAETFSYDPDGRRTETQNFYSSVASATTSFYSPVQLNFNFSKKNVTSGTEQQNVELLTSDREQQGLSPLPVSESDFTQGTVPFVSLTDSQQRYLNGTIITNTETNRIFVHVTLGAGVMGDEFQALNSARAEINNTYPNAPNVFLTEAVPVIIISSPGVGLRYGWQVKGTLDITQQQEQEDTESPFSTVIAQQEIATLDRVSLLFPKYSPSDETTPPQTIIDYKSGFLSAEQISALTLQGLLQNTKIPSQQDIIAAGAGIQSQQNIFIKKFADKIIPYLMDTGLSKPQASNIAYYKTFPQAYGALVDNMFDYVIDNGVFSATTLQSLNLFSLNDNCPPGEIADFLDVDGILDQMTEEFKEAACNSDNIPLSKKVRNIIKYGMYLLLIQIHVAEVIIKNIFVMAAFNLETLLDRDSFAFQFIRGQILQSLMFFLMEQTEQPDEAIIRQDLTSYFNQKIARTRVVNEGGIKFSDDTIAFPAGTQFSITDESTFAGFDEILDFLIYDRILRSSVPINNSLKKALPKKDQLPFNKAFIRSLPRLAVERDGDSRVAQYVLDPKVDEYLPESGFFLTIKTRIIETSKRGPKEVKKYKLWWKSVEESQTIVAKVLSLGVKSKYIDDSEPFESDEFATQPL
jgi:hypothetical protein